MRTIAVIAALLTLAACKGDSEPREPCWTEPECRAIPLCTCIAAGSFACMPVQNATISCTCPPRPVQHVEREEPKP